MLYNFKQIPYQKEVECYNYKQDSDLQGSLF